MFLFLFALLIFPNSVGSTHFKFSATLACWENVKWCARIIYYEYDPFLSDHLVTTETICDTKPGIKFKSEATIDGDGYFAENYDMRYNIKHNCSSNGDTYENTYKLYDVPTNYKKFTYDIAKVMNKTNHIGGSILMSPDVVEVIGGLFLNDDLSY